jgi:hypothetical protein
VDAATRIELPTRENQRTLFGANLAIGAALALFGVVGIISARNDPLSIVLFVLAIGWFLLAVRAFRSGFVEVDETGVTMVTFYRRRFIPKGAIAAVNAGPNAVYEGRKRVDTEEPYLSLTNGETIYLYWYKGRRRDDEATRKVAVHDVVQQIRARLGVGGAELS